MKKNSPRLHLALHLTLFVFAIMTLTALMVGGAVWLLYRLNFLGLAYLSPIYLLTAIPVISIAIGTALSAAVSRHTVKHLNVLISALQEVGRGNFDVRLSPPRRGGGKLAESFNAMAQELAGIETLRSDFVGNFSHEFKTPIVSIRGFAKLLKNSNLTEEERNEYLDIIFTESDRLAQLAANTLALSKLESQELVTGRAPYSLDEQLRRCVLLLEDEWSKKGIELTVSLPKLTFCGNEDLMRQLWINLIANAVKFTPQGGEIAISATRTAQDVVVAISDNGCGMSRETLARIFDKYYQGDPSHATPGNGLGLAIAKRITDLVGGSIEVKSRENFGSTFLVVLPIEE